MEDNPKKEYETVQIVDENETKNSSSSKGNRVRW